MYCIRVDHFTFKCVDMCYIEFPCISANFFNKFPTLLNRNYWNSHLTLLQTSNLELVLDKESVDSKVLVQMKMTFNCSKKK